ncbi:MAG TPA: DUF115 domain-containing protein [Bacillota bacterium]|nr:DUF115 domain-containing protein [Bacillota bacterium]
MTGYYTENLGFFSRGIKVLESAVVHNSNYPCEVEGAKDGSPTVRVRVENDRWILLHSRYNPAAEASKIISVANHGTGLYVVFGFGLGYHVDELIKVANPHASIAVIEPNRSCFETALRHRPFKRVFSDKRVHWFFGDDPGLFTHFFERVYDPLKAGRPELVVPPVMNRAYGDFFSKVTNIIKETVSRKMVSVNTIFALGAGPAVNTLKNAVKTVEYPGCASLFGKFRGKPAIIVSAGPSLDKNVRQLADAKGKAIIISVGTALKAVLKAGIEPDFVLSIDPKEDNYKLHFKGVDVGNAALVANLQTYPDIVGNFPGEVFLAMYNTPVTSLLAGELAGVGQTFSGGSVANDSLSFAYFLGADPLVMIGQDLSYTGEGKSHAAGTSYENDIINFKDMGINITEVKANYGDTVKTSRTWYAFLVWFERWIAEHGDRKYINATEGGAYIRGTEVATLGEVIGKYCREPVDVRKIIGEAYRNGSRVKPGILLKRFGEFKTELAELKKLSKNGLNILEKMNKISTGKKDKRQMEHLLKRIRKIYNNLEDVKIRGVVEGMVPGGVTAVLARTYAGQLKENDSAEDAIANYIAYLREILEGGRMLNDLLDELAAELAVKGDGQCQ